MSGSTNATPPQPGIPFLGPDGNISRAWFYFLLGIFNRTGGNTPTPITPAQLQQQISALFVEEAFDDVQFPSQPVSFPVLMGQALADDVPLVVPVSLPVLMGQALTDDAPRAVPISLPVMMGQMFADDTPRAPLNPLLAALMVADASTT